MDPDSGDARPRKLGYLEDAMHREHGCCVLMVAHLSGSRLLETSMQTCVRAAAQRHPNLRSVIDEQTLSLRELPGYSVQDCQVEFVQADNEEDAWKRVADKETNSRFEVYGSVPLWKVLVVQSAQRDVLMVKFHHCIGDAGSGFVLVNDLLTSYQQLTSSGALQVEPLPALPAADSLCYPAGRSEAHASEAELLLEELVRRRSSWTPVLKYDAVPPTAGHNTSLYRDGTEEFGRT
ncbi:unnamed protein product, partial [Polarella glacialis]